MSSADHALETFVPLAFRRRRRQLVSTDGREAHDVKLINGLARGLYWQQLIDSGAMANEGEIARAEGLAPYMINKLMRLALLAPDLVEQLIGGQQPRQMNLMWFMRNPLPADWQAQREIVRRFEEAA